MQPVNHLETNTQNYQVTSHANTPPASFSTKSCFLWLHEKNCAFKANIRGAVNHEYNRLLREKGLVFDLIPGREDFEQLGMDRQTPIVRPDLYLATCQKVMSVRTNAPFSGLNLFTAVFFDLLHEQNVKSSANVRGLVNQKYNKLLSENRINNKKIPGNNLRQLGIDKSTPLNAALYSKAYGEVIAQFEHHLGYSDVGPFRIVEVFATTIKFMGYGDIFQCAQVCKWWNHSSKNLNWQQFFRDEKIPFVESIKGKPSNYKQEFRILFPMTISGKMSEKLFGDFSEDIPFISRLCFEKCFKEDPFQPGKWMKDTFKFVVIPSAFERTSSAEFPFILDPKGDLQPVEPEKWTGEKLKIPNTSRNLQHLWDSRFVEIKKIRGIKLYEDEILNDYDTRPKKMSILFMSDSSVFCGVHISSYSKRKDLVRKKGFDGVASLTERLFFDAVCLLTADTCSDAKCFNNCPSVADNIFIGVRTTFRSVGRDLPLFLDYLKAFRGDGDGGYTSTLGIVPCISAEAPDN